MENKRVKNFISPVIYVMSTAMAVFITHLIIRAVTGAGIYSFGTLSASLLVFFVIFFGAVWCTIFFVGYQLQRISNNE